MILKVLETINRTRGVLGSAVVGNDGILIASETSDPSLAELTSALTASLAEIGNRISESIQGGPLRQILLEGEQGKVVVQSVPLGWLLVFTASSVNVGLVRVEMRKAAQSMV